MIRGVCTLACALLRYMAVLPPIFFLASCVIEVPATAPIRNSGGIAEQLNRDSFANDNDAQYVPPRGYKPPPPNAYYRDNDAQYVPPRGYNNRRPAYNQNGYPADNDAQYEYPLYLDY